MLLNALVLACFCTVEVSSILFLTDLLPSINLNPRPQRWHLHEHQWNGRCIKGHDQSPIDLVLGDAEVAYNEGLQFYNYQSNGPIIVDNRGHSGHIKGFLTWEEPPFFTESNSSERYFLRQLHFHWNSEHSFNGLHYPLELHLVHFRLGFKPKNDNRPSGVAVVAVVFLVGEQELEGIEDLLTAANSFRSLEPVSWFSPSVLLPNDRTTFFKYTGSLTTPPCTEGVTWFVFSEPKLISTKQLASLVGNEERPFVASARPVQPKNGRKLFLNMSTRGLSNSEFFHKVIVIAFLCIGVMLVPPFVVMWVIKQKSSTKPVPSAPTVSSPYHSAHPNTALSERY